MSEEPKITPDTFPSARVHVLAGLPKHLKDPANFKKIQRALIETLATTHSHSDILAWGACLPCQRKLHNHVEMQRKLGFKSGAQYMAWCKVHRKIEEFQKIKLPKYNKPDG